VNGSPHSKKRILDAARTEFAALGIAGARVDAIAGAAHINKQRVYAYYGTKEGLFEAVLADAFRCLADSVPLPTSWAELLEYPGRVFDYHVDNPEFSRLLAWEALTYGSAEVPGETERQAYFAEKLATIGSTIGDVDTGTVAAVLLEIIGLAAWPILMTPLQRHLHGLRPGQVPSRELTRDVVTQSAAAVLRQVERVRTTGGDSAG
jgi:AcrR family transcriptional regulator